MSFDITFRTLTAVVIPVLGHPVFRDHFKDLIISIQFLSVLPAVIYTVTEGRHRITVCKRHCPQIELFHVYLYKFRLLIPGIKPGAVSEHHIVGRLDLHYPAFSGKLFPKDRFTAAPLLNILFITLCAERGGSFSLDSLKHFLCLLRRKFCKALKRSCPAVEIMIKIHTHVQSEVMHMGVVPSSFLNPHAS